MKPELKKSAVDLTDLALSIVVLGIVVSIGAYILITFRDSRLTDLDTFSTANETTNATDSVTLTNAWFKSITSVINQTGGETITQSGNYSVSTNAGGKGVLVFDAAGSHYGTNVNVTYDSYNTTRPDWDVANDAAVGIAEYGNWFKIIVIVGVAAVVLSLIFMAFGNKGGQSGTGTSY